MGKPGIILMFIGAVLLAIFLFIDLPLSFGVWLACFLVSMLVATVGAVLSIIELIKGIKADAALKNK